MSILGLAKSYSCYAPNRCYFTKPKPRRYVKKMENRKEEMYTVVM